MLLFLNETIRVFKTRKHERHYNKDQETGMVAQTCNPSSLEG